VKRKEAGGLSVNLKALIAALVLALPISANADEALVKSPDLEKLFSDKSLYGTAAKAAVEQIFQKSGVTFYLENGTSSQGTWKIENNKYCSQWPPNPSWSCYDVMRDGDSVTFISSSGTRFPMSLKKQN
jgi:hypothetical protein